MIGALANTGRLILMRLAGERIIARLKTNIYKNLLSQDMHFFDSNRTGELISRLSTDTTIVGRSITNNISDGLRSLISSTIGIGAMAFVNSSLTLIMMSIVPPVAVAAVLYGRVVRDLSKRTQDALGESTKVAEEKLGNIRTVRAFAQEDRETKLYSDHVTDIYNLARREAFASGAFYGGTGFSGNVIILALLYYGGSMVRDGAMSIGDLTSFFLYTAYVGGSLIGLSSFYSELMKGVGASKRIFTLLDSPAQIESIKPTAKKIEHLEGLVEFKNVGFSYPTRPDLAIFTDLSFTVQPGSNVAIVGHSGSGKSSIAQLLLRFYDPSNGSVCIDGMELRDLDLSWWRRECVGIVSQEPVLFAGTIFENIQYGCLKESSIEDVERVADQANARAFIEAFPDGFNTFVGERGVAVSGGQRQRIAIARALLKNPKILIMDEATSALDASSEFLVSDALETLVQGRTTLTIAHRLSTIQKADYIIMIGDTGLNQRGVVEQGTFDGLLSIPDGQFKKLVEQQLTN